MSYLSNCWYMAGWATELGKEFMSRRFLNEPVLLYRDDDGQAHALADSCPHRFVPLSRGKLVSGVVECAYHGLRFGSDGRCVHNPQGDIPKGAAVKAYPLVEKHSILWIWMGKAAADPSQIPDFSCNDPATNYIRGAYLEMQNDYRFGTDNILDLSHIQFTHRDSLARALAGFAREESELKQTGDTVWSNRTYYSVPTSKETAVYTGGVEGSLYDAWINVRWNAPASMLLMSGSVPQGRDRVDPNGSKHTHIFTPRTSDTCHYWFGVTRPKGGRPPEAVDEELSKIRAPFANEDRPMLASQQQAFGDRDFWKARPIILHDDAAALRARRILERMIHEESSSGLSDSGQTASTPDQELHPA